MRAHVRVRLYLRHSFARAHARTLYTWNTQDQNAWQVVRNLSDAHSDAWAALCVCMCPLHIIFLLQRKRMPVPATGAAWATHPASRQGLRTQLQTCMPDMPILNGQELQLLLLMRLALTCSRMSGLSNEDHTRFTRSENLSV